MITVERIADGDRFRDITLHATLSGTFTGACREAPSRDGRGTGCSSYRTAFLIGRVRSGVRGVATTVVGCDSGTGKGGHRPLREPLPVGVFAREGAAGRYAEVGALLGGETAIQGRRAVRRFSWRGGGWRRTSVARSQWERRWPVRLRIRARLSRSSRWPQPA